METFSICCGVILAPILIFGWLGFCKLAGVKKAYRNIGLAVICLPFLVATISMGKYMLFDEPMISASCDGDLARVKRLVSAGGNVNVQTDFHNPLGCSLENGHEEVALYLIEHGADVNEESYDHSPLTIARDQKLLKAVEALKKRGAK